jgi:hypothetical protein
MAAASALATAAERRRTASSAQGSPWMGDPLLGSKVAVVEWGYGALWR